MSKRPLCVDEPHFMSFKKSRVARFLLVPGPRPTHGVSISSQLNEAELATLQEYGSLLPWLTAANAKRKQITDAFVEVLSAAAPNLRDLSLSGNAALTDSSMMLLGFRCRRLKTLELQGCDGVTAQGLEFVIANCRNDLEVLDVRGCPLVDDSVAHAIAMCPNIHELYLSGTSITSAGVRAIVASCKNLEIIDVSGVALTSPDVQHIMASLAHLRAVDISFCTGVFPGDVQHIFDINPSVNIKAFGLDLFGVRVPTTGALIY